METTAKHTNPTLRVDLRGHVFDRHTEQAVTPVPFGGILYAPTTRRRFLKIGGAAGLSLAAALLLDDLIRAGVASARAGVVLADAKGVLIADSHLCVACRRCELACSEYNLGKAQPYLSNIKVYRNMNYGTSMGSGEGIYEGNMLVRQETCKQCRNPVPCASACPQGAITADTEHGWNARKINTAACVGCGACAEACPYDMCSVDPDATNPKAKKCFLCDGDPECAAVCPTGALQFVAWREPASPVDVAVPTATTTQASDDDRGGCFLQTLKRN